MFFIKKIGQLVIKSIILRQFLDIVDTFHVGIKLFHMLLCSIKLYIFQLCFSMLWAQLPYFFILSLWLFNKTGYNLAIIQCFRWIVFVQKIAIMEEWVKLLRFYQWLFSFIIILFAGPNLILCKLGVEHWPVSKHSNGNDQDILY